MAVANAHPFFSAAYLAELEPCSGFRFDFLRARNQKLDDRESLFPRIFEAFLEAGDSGWGGAPQRRESVGRNVPMRGEVGALNNSFV